MWGNCGSDAYHMQHYRNVDNTMRAYPEIAAKWEEAGITPDKWVAFYCGTGWRASETWFYAYLMGWQRIAVYDGGWFEWSKDPINNPIEVGEPEDPQDEAARRDLNGRTLAHHRSPGLLSRGFEIPPAAAMPTCGPSPATAGRLRRRSSS